MTKQLQSELGQRERFEDWMRSRRRSLSLERDASGDYKNSFVWSAWKGWQAALAQREERERVIANLLHDVRGALHMSKRWAKSNTAIGIMQTVIGKLENFMFNGGAPLCVQDWEESSHAAIRDKEVYELGKEIEQLRKVREEQLQEAARRIADSQIRTDTGDAYFLKEREVLDILRSVFGREEK